MNFKNSTGSSLKDFYFFINYFCHFNSFHNTVGVYLIIDVVLVSLTLICPINVFSGFSFMILKRKRKNCVLE